MNNQTTVNQQNNKPFLFEYWYVVLFVIAFLLVVIAQILRLLTPSTPPDNIETWNGLAPGFASVEQVNKQLGAPIDSKQTDLGNELQYQSVYPATPNKAVADTAGQVKFMRETIKYDKENTLDKYVAEFGESDLEMWAPTAGYGLKAYVYLNRGLVIIAHLNSTIVSEKWYFQPTSQEDFMQTWGRDLTNEEMGPEALDATN